MLPMNAIAYHFVRILLDNFLVTTVQNLNVLAILRTLYSPLTEEPAKLFILTIPYFLKRIKEFDLVKIALVIGLVSINLNNEIIRR